MRSEPYPLELSQEDWKCYQNRDKFSRNPEGKIITDCGKRYQISKYERNHEILWKFTKGLQALFTSIITFGLGLLFLQIRRYVENLWLQAIYGKEIVLVKEELTPVQIITNQVFANQMQQNNPTENQGNDLSKKNKIQESKKETQQTGGQNTISNKSRLKKIRTKVIEEFQKLQLECSCFTYPEKRVGKNEENLKKNRYMDIIPSELYRVGKDEKKYGKGFYINASKLVLEDCTYYQAQGPMQHTLDDFWQMIINENIATIACTTQDFERGIEKCYPYWSKLPNSVDGWEISVEVISTENGLTERRFKLKKDGNEPRIIVHLHFEKWPDHGVPDQEEFNAFVNKLAEHERNNPGQSLNNCSAGVGRSGTTIVRLHQILHPEYFKRHTLFDTIKNLRIQRGSNYFVQTVEQFNLLTNKSVSKSNKAFL